MTPTNGLRAATALAALLMIAGCGSSASSSGAAPAAPGAPAASGGSGSAGALSADARSAATGDIPDNQVFLVFQDPKAGYSMKYPEGWTQMGNGNSVTFRDKNNLVQVTVAPGAQPSAASLTAQMRALKQASPTLTFTAPSLVSVGGARVLKTVYVTESAPNPVTGRRVRLIVDRYELTHNGKVATVDLGTPSGVDNVDAYRMMINSLRWR